MAKQWKSVKTNIFLGYITLVLIASATVWLIYNETLELYDNQIDMSPVNEKIVLANSILTNLYDVEGFESSYLQTGNKDHFKAYNILMDSISYQIDSLGKMVSDPAKQMHTDSIQKLLTQKRRNLRELVSIKNAGSSDNLYERAMIKLASNKDSINQLLKIYKTVNTTKDSVFVKQKKQKFFERLIHVFSPQEKADSAFKVIVNQSIQVDSIINKFSPADSVELFLSSIIDDIRKESVAYEKQLNIKEQEILDNDQTITLQIRKILSDLDNEELISSLNKVRLQQESINKITKILVILGAVALLVVVGFLIFILKDITKSQHYRQNLEKEKAYSESLLKSKEQFMLSITHDLKSPLSSIIGFSQLIEREKVSERQQHYLQSIGKSADYILRLINDLLDFARLETGKLKIEIIRFNLKSVIDEVVSGFYPLASAKNLHLNIQTDGLAGKNYLADPARIKQVMGNLISNAVKFTDNGQITVKGSIVSSKAQTDFVQLEVIDTGIGISKENAQLIFEEFSRVSSDNNKQYEGTGLGLAITKRIVELMNGTIKLDSHDGRGSHFTIILPLRRQTETAKNKQDSVDSTGLQQNKKFSFHNEQVLLVDDDPFLLEMTTNVLKEANLQVTSFTEPRKAIKAINQQTFDLLITDIQMPRMDGFELLFFYKKANLNPRAIAVTGESSREQVYKNAGFSAILHKPYQPRDLLMQVSYIINGKEPQVLENSKSGKSSVPVNGSSVYYNIEGIKAFAQDDPETIHKILISFDQSTAQNMELFKELLNNEDRENMAKLAHKMLPMFKQLEASSVIGHLAKLEQNKFGKDGMNAWKKIAESTLLGIEAIMEKMREDHQIPFSGNVIL